MASSTTVRKIALVVGPRWWGDDWAARDGQSVHGRDGYAARLVNAEAEARALHAQLDELPDDAAILLVGSSGATRLTSLWADEHRRLTIRVPLAGGVGIADAEALAVDLALAVIAAGQLVKALACVTGPDDPTLAALRGRGLPVRPVPPLYVEPDPDAGPPNSVTV